MAHVWFRGTSSEASAPVGVDGSVEVRFVVDSGWRPVVSALVDGVEVSMLVHANAGFIAMLTHDALRRVSGRTVPKDSDFGLGHDLQLSKAGRGHTVVSSLSVAGHPMSNVRLEIFDLPTVNWEGMVGVHWLAASRAVLDFGQARLSIPSSPRVDSEPAGVHLPMWRDEESGRFLSTLSAGSAPAPASSFVVSTVAETTLDLEYAREIGLDLGHPVDEEHGPTGAVVAVYRPQLPISLFAGDAEIALVAPTVYDLYGYSGSPRPDSSRALAGYIGADLLLRERAVVDFG